MRSLAALLLLAFPLPQSVSASPALASAPTYSVRWLSNALISRIWPLPNSQSSTHKHGSPSTGGAKTDRDHGGRGAPALYSQDIVLRFNLSNAEEARAIAEAAEDFSLDIWAYSENWVDLRLAKDFLPSLLTILPKSLSTAHAPLIPESTFRSLVSAPHSPSSGSDSTSFRHSSTPSSKDLFFSDYQPLNAIQPWLSLLSSMFPGHTRLITLGTSYNGREILGLRIGRRPPPIEDPSDPDHPILPPRRPRKTILITGGAHAREWISVSAVNYVAHQLVTLYGKGKDSFATRLVDEFDWILIPTLNPDGYEHSWSSDRLWRKNRQPTSLRFCSGIDLDRGFGYRFDEDAAGRMSPCSEAWSGGYAWEAYETRRVKEWVGNLTSHDVGGGSDELVAYLDLHSYSQQILYPYAYTCDEIPPTLENLEELAMGLARAMGRVGGKGYGYNVAAACEGNVLVKGDGAKKKSIMLPSLETGGGSPLDWFYHEVGVRYAFQLKLRDTGSYGFLLPREEIIPQGKEVFAAVSHLGKFLLGEIGLGTNDEDELLQQDTTSKESTSVVVDEDDAVREELASEHADDDEEWNEEERLLSRLEFRKRRLR